jgi:hypothetical protein
MQTLGLTGEDKRSDGLLKSIFWPAVENAWDVDYLGRQGLTICTVVGVLQLVMALLAGNPAVLVLGVTGALVFLIGGMGVREGSWPAAAFIFSLYVIGVLSNVVVGGQFPGVLPVLIAGVLLSNLRAAFLASQWKPSGEDEDRPTRFNEGIMDFLADQLPTKVWPVLRFPFYGLASLLLIASLLGSVMVVLHGGPASRHSRSAPGETIELPVRPPS